MSSTKFLRKRKILFVTYGGGHVNRIVPLVQKLNETSRYDLIVLGLTTAGIVLEREGIAYLGYRHLETSKNQRAMEWGKRLSENIESNLVEPEETAAYLGLNYIDLENRLGIEQAARVYAEKGRAGFLPLTVMEEFIKEIKPDLVFATNSPRSERAAIMVAGKMGIPSVCHLSMFCSSGLEWIGQPGYANKLCLSSDYLKKDLLAMGRSPDEIVVTGNPAFDRLADEHLGQQRESIRKTRDWENHRVILWASQVEPERHLFTGESGDPALPRIIEKILFTLLKKHPDWRLVVRPHPSENVQHHNLPDRVEISSYEEEHALLIKAVDVVVTMTSTVGQEAFLLGTPLVTLNLSVFKNDVPYMESGMSRGVNQLEDLEEALLDVLERGWAPETLLPPIGQATQNVMDVIESVMEDIPL